MAGKGPPRRVHAHRERPIPKARYWKAIMSGPCAQRTAEATKPSGHIGIAPQTVPMSCLDQPVPPAYQTGPQNRATLPVPRTEVSSEHPGRAVRVLARTKPVHAPTSSTHVDTGRSLKSHSEALYLTAILGSLLFR